MIHGREDRNPRAIQDTDELPEYWQGYFQYRGPFGTESELHQLVHSRLISAVETQRNSEDQVVDSQRVIGEILTDFGTQHNFHRQFAERHPGLQPNQILGMHLYDVMVQDDDTWVFTETQHAGHVYPHATYFLQQP